MFWFSGQQVYLAVFENVCINFMDQTSEYAESTEMKTIIMSKRCAMNILK